MDQALSIKRRVMAALMAVMLLMTTSVTAFAQTVIRNRVTGHLTKKSSTKVEAMTSLRDQAMEPPMYTYDKMRVRYTSADGGVRWSDYVSDYAPRYSVAIKTINGTLKAAESVHGIRPTDIEVELYIPC